MKQQKKVFVTGEHMPTINSVVPLSRYNGMNIDENGENEEDEKSNIEKVKVKPVASSPISSSSSSVVVVLPPPAGPVPLFALGHHPDYQQQQHVATTTATSIAAPNKKQQQQLEAGVNNYYLGPYGKYYLVNYGSVIVYCGIYLLLFIYLFLFFILIIVLTLPHFTSLKFHCCCCCCFVRSTIASSLTPV